MGRELSLLMAGANTAATRGDQITLLGQCRCMSQAMYCKPVFGMNMLVDRIGSCQVCRVVMTASHIKHTPERGEKVNYEAKPCCDPTSHDQLPMVTISSGPDQPSIMTFEVLGLCPSFVNILI
jgi:hypothetical protein